MNHNHYSPNAETQEIPHDFSAATPTSLQHQLVRVTENGIELDRYSIKTGVVTIGRLQDSRLVLKDNSISRRHARLWIVKKICWLEDLGSRNGTFVNGQKIRLQRLQDGDRLQLGAIHLKFVVTADATDAAQDGLPASI